MAATSVKLAEKLGVPSARLTFTTLSSRGCWMRSSTRAPNSGSTPPNDTPWWARLISLRRGQCSPPTNPAWLMVWAGQAGPAWPGLPVLWLWKLEQMDSYPT